MSIQIIALSGFVLLYLLSPITGGVGEFVNKEISKFPHPLNAIFHIQFHSLNDQYSLSITNTMVVRIVDGEGSRKQQEIFDYVAKNKIDERYNGEYMDIPEWINHRRLSEINISILFKIISNGLVVQIYDLPAPSFDIRRSMLNNLLLATLLYNETIQLVSPSKLRFTVNSISGESVKLKPDEFGIAKCRSSDGIPKETPRFSNLQYFQVVNETNVSENNEVEVNLRMRVEDHGKHLICGAGSTISSMLIKILHPTTEILILPKVNKTLEGNSTILCYPKDGYPQTFAQWYLVSGPSNASLFYEIRNNGSVLHMKDFSPKKSNWKFSCSLKSKGVANQMSESISFVITGTNCDNDCLNDQINSLKQMISIQNRSINEWKYTNEDRINKLKDVNLKLEEDISKLRQKTEIIINDSVSCGGIILKQSNEIENLRKEIGKNQDKELFLNQQIKEIIQTNKQFNESLETFKETVRVSLANITERGGPVSTTNSESTDKIPDLQWTIYDVVDKFNDERSFYKYFYLKQKIYEMCLNVDFRDDTLQMDLVSFKNDKYKARYPLRLQASIFLINTLKPKVFKTMTKSFHFKKDWKKGPKFMFTKEELQEVIKNESITIRCFITLM